MCCSFLLDLVLERGRVPADGPKRVFDWVPGQPSDVVLVPSVIVAKGREKERVKLSRKFETIYV